MTIVDVGRADGSRPTFKITLETLDARKSQHADSHVIVYPDRCRHATEQRRRQFHVRGKEVWLQAYRCQDPGKHYRGAAAEFPGKNGPAFLWAFGSPDDFDIDAVVALLTSAR